MDGMVGSKSSLTWIVNISVVLLVALWLFPTVGLLVSSFRTADQISSNGWWQSLFPTEQNVSLRTDDPDGAQELIDGLYTVSGNVFGDGSEAVISVWGVSSRAIDSFGPGDTADLGEGESITVQVDGS